MNLLSCPHSSMLCINLPNTSFFKSHLKLPKLPLSSSSKPSTHFGCFNNLFSFHFHNPRKTLIIFNFSPSKNVSRRINNYNKPRAYVDEWGEKSTPDEEPTTRFPDPRGGDDEWGGTTNGVPPESDVEDEELRELKKALVDNVYGTESGFGASSEVRAEALELVQKLEAANPTPKPTQATELLDGNWVLVYTAFSELLPLLAAGRIPTVKVEKICQRIDATNLTIENSTTLSGPVATFSFSALANFEVQSPCRIQVQFKEGSFNPPDIKSTIDLPENVNIFGQNISLSPVQQSLNPLQTALANIAQTISSQSPLKIPIPGERTKSWLLITYLDKDLRISRGDGGLFVLVKEGSPLLYQ